MTISFACNHSMAGMYSTHLSCVHNIYKAAVCPVQPYIIEDPEIQSNMSPFVRISIIFNGGSDGFLCIFRLVLLLQPSRWQGLVQVCDSQECQLAPIDSSTALAIIAEHSFYLWDQEPSQQVTSLITAINTYKTSNNHTAITQAVDEIFNANEGPLFDEAKSSMNLEDSAFAEQLIQIALDHRLCMSHLVP